MNYDCIILLHHAYWLSLSKTIGVRSSKVQLCGPFGIFLETWQVWFKSCKWAKKHLWVKLSITDRPIEVTDRPSSDAQDLQQVIIHVWVHEITAEFCKSLVDIMPRHLQAVLKINCGMTKYWKMIKILRNSTYCTNLYFHWHVFGCFHDYDKVIT